MTIVHISIREINDLKKFVNLASQQSNTVVCRRGIFSVDASSLLGMMSIDTADGFLVEFTEPITGEFANFLTRHKK